MTGTPTRPWLTWEGNGRPPAVSEQHAAARFWASHGFPVCRLIERDKRPTDRAPKTAGAGPEHRLATLDLDVVDHWWQEVHPYWGPRSRCNPGLPTGSWPGYLALDVDHPSAFEAWVDDRQLPATLRWSSCRPDRPERYTLLFKYPALDFPIRSVVDGRPQCVPGVDLRADGEHVVLPGAVHVQGTVYSIQRNVLAADLPPWLVAELRERSRSVPSLTSPRRSCRVRNPVGRPAPASLVVDLPFEALCQAYANALRLFERAAGKANVARGQRHHTLIGLVWEGLARGLRPDDVREAVLVYYVERACPGRGDRPDALSQLEEALEHPRACSANEPRFSVWGQARWLLDNDPRWRNSRRSCRHPVFGR